MEFKLKKFVNLKDFRTYEVIKPVEYDIDNPKANTDISTSYPMIIYKKDLKSVIGTNEGVEISSLLVGKIENKYKLENNDIIIVFNKKYRVVKLLPRIYSDFSEFELEKMTDDE